MSIAFKEKYKNVKSVELDLTNVFDKFTSNLPDKHTNQNELCLANVRNRLRMTTLYYSRSVQQLLSIRNWKQSRRFGAGFLQNMVMVEDLSPT